MARIDMAAALQTLQLDRRAHVVVGGANARWMQSDAVPRRLRMRRSLEAGEVEGLRGFAPDGVTTAAATQDEGQEVEGPG